MFLTIVIVFISLIGLIVLHELGHFILAKKFGVKVEEFGVFLPPRLFGKKIGETTYSLNLLPLGAFVKLYGEDATHPPPSEEKIEASRTFQGKPIWQRVLIVLGGVVSFWLISVVLLSIVFGIGAPQAISDEENHTLLNPKVQIVAIVPGSPAQIAGIKIGDTIKQFSISLPQEMGVQFSIDKVKEVQELTEKYKGKEITLTIERGKEVFDVSLVPRVSPPEGEGAMGVALARMIEKSYPWEEAPVKGIEATFNLTKGVIVGISQVFGNLIQGKGLPPGAEVMGPVGIGKLMTQIAQMGINYYLQFVAIISVYLAIFNILPIPALDGGKLLFLGIEKVRRKPVSQKVEQNITAVFFALLITLMIWVTIKDITRLF
ncbi:RIP metalloprotease RseP [bacterium]|uniref:Zinc metalloprotease n=3 Tax=Candidatus Nealsoniibacteriota TaxID=1817911 RepID=A0A2M7H105_9BACT|nr:RIP metalloprotease RseP [bacterium]PIW34840.1 MAG: RIP metalloprotease RseP [Candidatus Nealsonbacteria bacterium CG15_BIG_FIL_POST_REV_8_21_14_020_37_12]